MRISKTRVEHFLTDRDALDFIASRIADEAQREGASLSEVERKMLYFSETAWTLPDIWTVNDEFDREYDQNAYEKKISKLIKSAVSRARRQNREELETWSAAVRRLNKEDRYLLVMIGPTGLGRAVRSAQWPWNSWKPWAAGLAMAAIFATFTWVVYTISPYPGGCCTRSGRYTSRLAEAFSFSLWAFPFSVAVIYGVLSLFRKQGKIVEIFGRTLEWIFCKSKRIE